VQRERERDSRRRAHRVCRAGGSWRWSVSAERPTQRGSARTSARADAGSARGASICQHQRQRGESKECGGASARTSTGGANASAGGRASARTSARGADARSAGRRASASTSAGGAIARSVECKPQGVGPKMTMTLTRRGLSRRGFRGGGFSPGSQGRAAAEAQKDCAHSRQRCCPETRALSPLPEHTALLQQSACQNRICAPLLPQPLCWSWKSCQSSRGPSRLCMSRCRPPSCCTPLPRWRTPSPAGRSP
jgi:hypothetical protein